ncbi:TetR/AcrR family transcriptional regulator [Parvibaculaceae bacterium PLY_AMNH_Bact1]|nr:TetR/AcrR family transcriptional regulator [Parvibaculaceae bacterium PLY_AMNH_Bact1]
MSIAEDKTTQQVDGRLNRSTRTRAAIVEAMVALVGEGNASPTSEEVAEQANVGLRTVFRHFEDMETLYQEMDQVVKARVFPEFDPKTLTGPLEERARTLIERRAHFFETIHPFMMCTISRKWRSPYLARSYDAFADLQRNFLFKNLPELQELSPALQHAADQVASYDSWTRMKNVQKLGAADAIEAQLAGILAIIRGA